MKVLHSWLHEYIGDPMPDAAMIEQLLTFHAFEIEGTEVTPHGETVIDVKVLPDRAADALSHRGIAREIATHLGKPLAYDPFTEPAALPVATDTVSLRIENSTHCRRFMAAVVRGVTVSESPAWLKQRLEALGQRSINNIVDATNYVMLALGQPLHAYDAARLTATDGVYALTARSAIPGEVITTLSGEQRTLDDTMTVIADEATGTALSIAGVKGGAHAQITVESTDIVLEAASFDPQRTRKAAQSLRLPTDAAKRFENNLSPDVAPYALAELIALVLRIAGGTCEGYADVYPVKETNPSVSVSHARINALLGISLSRGDVSQILARLGFQSRETDDGWVVTAPFERRDIRLSEDVVEEVGRVYGYEHVPEVLLDSMPIREVNVYQYYSERIRTILTHAGFSEVITSSFRKKDVVTLHNALASDKGCLRSTLTENIREALDRNMPNADLLGLSRIQIFEIGTVFHKTEDGTDITEHTSLAIGVRTKQQGYTPKDDARLAEIMTLLEQELGTSLRAHIEKGVLECDLTACIKELTVPQTYMPHTPSATTGFAPYSAYPFVSRDIALWVPEGTNDTQVREMIRSHAGPLLIAVRLFDTFTKDGRTSCAFRLIFQSFERTLTDDEIGVSMAQITAYLESQGYEIR